MNKSIQDVEVAELHLKDILICQLYNVLYMRQNCSNCGGAGRHWVGEEAEPCNCWNESHDILQENEAHFMELMAYIDIYMAVSENEQYYTASDEIAKNRS